MMNRRTQYSFYASKALLVLATVGGLTIGLKNLALAQSPLPAAPAGVTQPYPSRTSYGGRIESYLLNPQGQVNGFILRNGLQVRFPPNNANNLAAAVKPGDSVTVTGTPGFPSNFGQEVRATSVTNISTQRTVVNQPPTYPPAPPAYGNSSPLSVAGTVRHWLVGHRGEIKGAILSSGTQVTFPPSVGSQLFNQARTGARVQAQGFGTSNNYGRILRANSLTVDGRAIAINPAGGPQAYGKLKGRKRGRGLGPLPAYGPPPNSPSAPPAYSSPPPNAPPSLPSS